MTSGNESTVVGRQGLRTGRLFFVVHSETHLEILRATIRLVERAGHPVSLVAVHPRAIDVLDGIGRSWIDVAAMEAAARPGDIIVLAADWGPPMLVDAIGRLKGAGVRVIGVVEAPRFALPDRYRQVDEMLVWAPTAKAAFDVPVHVVGSPVLEKRLAKRRPARRKGPILVNYKNAPPERAEEGAGSWFPQVLSACRGKGRVVLSAHPAAVGVPPDAVPSNKPIGRLLRKARLLISRPSMTVHQALAIGTPVVLFPRPGEELCEFADPMGAFRIARSPDELRALVADACRGAPDASTAFLDHHLHVDPDRRSSQRMADAILDALRRNMPAGIAAS
ncbi:hypothetical protein SAMN02982931_00692 [Bauldia litoralis]|uniref:Uncharacterized protein n=1 Tax=Bauldia litoralis TaxID=665467 RepID=A0A1G6AIQ1_9HYPH|nr:hypothetical protein SAMN02982931_00692 [Bauldia litoralis]